MIKRFFIIFFYIITNITVFGQVSFTYFKGDKLVSNLPDSFCFCNNSNNQGVILINGCIVNFDTMSKPKRDSIQQKLVAFALAKDKFWAIRYFGSYEQDTSIIKKYFGSKRDYGIVFLFTKDRVTKLTTKELKDYVSDAGNDVKILWKIDGQPFTLKQDEKIHYNRFAKIQMVKSFPLKHWDTGKTDTFTLFIIKTKE